MLALIREGITRKNASKDSIFEIRGRQITLGDALHYFTRKGVKDPESLLGVSPSLPLVSDLSCLTTECQIDEVEPSIHSDDRQPLCDVPAPPTHKGRDTHWAKFAKPEVAHFTTVNQERESSDERLEVVCSGSPTPSQLPSLKSVIPSLLSTPKHYQKMENVLSQTRDYYGSIFKSDGWVVNSKTWSATSCDSLSDRFFFGMVHGQAYLWSGQNKLGFQAFDQSFSLIRNVLTERDVGFMIYIYDLIIRLEGGGLDALLHRLLQFLAEMARTVFSPTHPVRIIASTMLQTTTGRSDLAEAALKRLVDFFQDSIGYLHQETIALLQVHASALMNREQYIDAAVRFRQLLEAFETIHGEYSYEACFALRVLGECFYHQGLYDETRRTLEGSLARSQNLPLLQKAEIRARYLRGMGEVHNRLGNRAQALAKMEESIVLCTEVFGLDHPFTARAAMHRDSLLQRPLGALSTVPPMVHRVGKGGNAALFIWISHSHPPLA